MDSKRVLIKNIKELHLAGEELNKVLIGKELEAYPSIENAFLAIEDGKIAGYGSMDDWGGITDWNNLEIIDARDQFVLPAFCDSHTHLIFAKSREQEFEDRIHGLSYEEIAAKGGGILNSAKALANKSDDELFELAKSRLLQVIKQGTGAIEIKSGYGLSKESELKMLRVATRLKDLDLIPVKRTFLGAHAIPPEYKENPQAYLDLMLNEVLPQALEEGLVDYIDIFCEKNYFNLEHTEQVLLAAKKHGIKAKIHVNQFNSFGGVPLCVKHHAKSVDHLEELNDQDLDTLKSGDTIAVALPSCSFFLNIPYTNGRKLIDEGVPFALASDFNPGSTPSGNLQFVFSLACIKMKLSPKEAMASLSLNGAAAMDLQDELGSISVGKRANIILTKPMESLAYLPYSFGEDLIDQVLINGKPLL